MADLSATRGERRKKMKNYVIEKAWALNKKEMKALGIKKREITVELERDGIYRVFADGRQFGELKYKPRKPW